MNKVLILTVTAGTGHNAVANALKQKYEENGKIVKIVDTFNDYNKKFKQFIINDGYLLTCTLLPHIYNLFFETYANLNPNKRDVGPTQDFLKSVTPDILKTVYEFQPDVIICTHFYPSIILTNLRKAYPINAKIVSILTDYVVHPFWESAIGVDYIVTPCEEVKETLLYKGYSKSQIKCLGFPIKEKFDKEISKADAKKQLSLQEDILTVCVTCGGYGSAKMPDIIKKLIKVKYPLQIISVCGMNKLSKRKIDAIAKSNRVKKLNKTILNYGYSNEIDLLFSASDVMIGKGGCTFINEAMKKGLPQIFIKNLPAQEQYNAEYLKYHDAALIASIHFDVDKILNMICSNISILDSLKNNIYKIRKTNALNDIFNFTNEFKEVNYCKDIEIVKRKVLLNIKKANKVNSVTVENISYNPHKTYKKIKRIRKVSNIKQNKLFKTLDKKVS